MKKYNKFNFNNDIKKLTEVKTVFDESIEEENIKINNELFESELDFNVIGLGVERSYEDRSVYVDINFKEKTNKNTNIHTWINGEDAIKLGQLLIKHGLYSLESNMINHQKIHHYSQLYKYLQDKSIDKIEMTNISEDGKEYTGAKRFKIKPIWKKGKEPKYNKDFNFDDIIYISPFKKEFINSLKEYGGLKKIIFINFNYEDEVNKFNEWGKQFESIKNNTLEEIFKYINLKKFKKISIDLLEKSIDSFNTEVNNYILLERLIMNGFDWNALNLFNRMKIVINNSNVNHKIHDANDSQILFSEGEIYNINGLTPLHINALMATNKSYEEEMLKLLTEAGANWDVLDNNKKSIFDYTKNIDIYKHYKQYDITTKKIDELKTIFDFNI